MRTGPGLRHQAFHAQLLEQLEQHALHGVAGLVLAVQLGVGQTEAQTDAVEQAALVREGHRHIGVVRGQKCLRHGACVKRLPAPLQVAIVGDGAQQRTAPGLHFGERRVLRIQRCSGFGRLQVRITDDLMAHLSQRAPVRQGR